jgi:ATP-dependent exoDNAse (exonuclease V) beta subunit
VIIGRPVSRRLQEQTQTDFLQALDGEAVAARLSREAYADWTVDALQVHREWPLLVRIDGRLIRGRIDRLVVGLRDGQIVAAEVIDFKSGRVDDAKAIVEHYRPQIEWYQTAIAAHFEIDQADIGGRLLFIDADLDLPCHSCPTAPSSS